VARRYVNVLIGAGRYQAADSVGTTALKTAPENVWLLSFVIIARLQQGDVPGARAVLHEAQAHVPGRELVTQSKFAWTEFAWLMDDSLRELALRLPPEAFDEDRAAGLMAIAQIKGAMEWPAPPPHRLARFSSSRSRNIQPIGRGCCN
jgi:hypothetical protein